MRRTMLFALALVGTAGCRGRAHGASPHDAMFQAHLSDAQEATRGEPGPAPASLTDFERKLLEIRTSWAERLGDPRTILTFLDVTTPEMAKLCEEAAREDFPASLSRGISVERLLAGAFVRSPTLLAAQRELAATVEQYAQVTYLDTILRQYVSFLRTLNTRVGPAVPMDRVQERFPFPGTLELKAAIVGHAVEAARAKYELALQDLVTGVRTAYADYLYLGRELEVTGETIRLLEQLDAVARAKLGSGTAPKSHVLRTQVEIASLRNDLVTRRREREIVRTRLVTLLNLAPETPFGEPSPSQPPVLPPDLVALETRALQRHPQIALARARADRMAAMIELAERATYPELSPGLSFMEEPSFAKESEPFSTRPKGIPDPWFGTKEAYLREAREAEKGSRRRLDAARDQTLFRVNQAYTELDTAWRLHDLYRDVQLAQAEDAYRDAASGYVADRGTFLDVIDALRLRLRFRIDAHRADRDTLTAGARLESAIGAPIAHGEK